MLPILWCRFLGKVACCSDVFDIYIVYIVLLKKVIDMFYKQWSVIRKSRQRISGKEFIFIIHPSDPRVVICYLIWPCDIAARITYLVSHSYSLSYNTVIIVFFMLVYNKYKIILVCSYNPPYTARFSSWCHESTCPTDSCFHQL